MPLKEGEKLTNSHSPSYEHSQSLPKLMSFSPSNEHLEGPPKFTIFL